MALFDNPSQASDLFEFGIDETAKGYLLDTARWSKFLAVLGFVFLGLLLVAGFFSGVILSNTYSRLGATVPSGLLFVVYAVLAVLYFFPTWYLFKFSVRIKPALLTNDQQGFNSALSYLRNAFRFVGI